MNLTLISREIVDFLGVLDFLAVDNFDFTRKILDERIVKMLGFFFVKIEFLDKNLTFIIV